MPDSHPPSHPADVPIEDRFLRWVDELVDPAAIERTPDSDFAEIARTSRSIQRVAGSANLPLPPTDRIDAIWEEIMNTTPTAPTFTTALPASRSTRLAPFRLPNPAPTVGWRSYLMTALLIAVIAVAALAATWRIAGPLGGGDPEQTGLPGVAHPATPAMETASDCPLTSDIVVLKESEAGVRRLPLLPTTAIVRSNGDFVLSCGEVEHPKPILTGVLDARSLQWPGTVLLEIEGGDAVAVNVATGQRVYLGPHRIVSQGYVSQYSSPWLVTANNAAHTDWRITNLRTMTSIVLSDEIGGVLADQTTLGVTWTPESPVAIFTPEDEVSQTPLPENLAGATIVELPGRALVVDESLTTVRWIDPFGAVAVDREGKHIAYQPDTSRPSVLRVEQSLTGDVVAEFTDIDFNPLKASTFAFSGVDNTIVYLERNDVWLAEWGEAEEQQQLDSGDLRPSEVHASAIPGRVLLLTVPDPEVAIAIVDTQHGTIAQAEGRFVDHSVTLGNLWSQLEYVVTMSPAAGSDAQTVVTLVDIATAETVLASDPLSIPIRGTSDLLGQTFLVNGGQIALVRLFDEATLYFNAETGAVSAITADPLEDLLPFRDATWLITPSSDGHYLLAYATREPTEMELVGASYLSSAPEWQPVFGSDIMEAGDTSMPPLAIIPALPSAPDMDEPAVLEAQEITPFEASPIATPQVASTACDLTRDIPIVTGSTDLQWDQAMFVLDDGTLALQCEGERTVFETGVLGAAGSNWPGAILLTLEDGSVQGVNLISGQSSELAPAGSYSEPFSPEPLVNSMPGSRWMVLPANADLTDWRIVDLETMESLLLSDELGGVLPTPLVARLNTSGDTAAVITFPIRPSPDDLGRAPLIEASETNAGELPSSNAALVIVDSLEHRRWTEASSVPEMSVSTSHDETLLAAAVPTDRGMTIRVERLADGELVADTGIDYNAGDSFFVLDNEAGVLHLTNQRLALVTWSPEPSSETLLELEPGDGLPTMALTADPNIVVISAINSIGEGRGYLVNIATGEVIEIPNLLHRSLTLQASEGRPPQHVLAASPSGTQDEQSTLQLIDVTTGEAVVTSGLIDMEPAQLQQGLSMLRASGTIGFSFNLPGHVIVLNGTTGDVFEFQVPSDVEGVPENHWWHVYPSFDGRFFLTSPDFEPGSPHYMRELIPNADWIELPPSPSGIVRGAASAAVHGEPAANAPDADASASREAGTSDCELSEDLLVLDGELESPLPSTTVLMLEDGELWIRCGDNSSLIESGVARTFPGSTWPGAVLVTMEDGTLRGINIATGARGDFGPASVLEENVGPYTVPFFAPNAPWAVFPANLELTDWRFIDLRTMESRLLSEEIGGVLPGSTAMSPFAFTSQAAIFGFPGVPVLAGDRQHPLGPGGATPQAVSMVSELPFENAALVIDGSLEHIRWVEVDSRSMMRATISSDGDLVAVAQPTDGGLTVRVEHLADGEVVAETGIDYGAGDTMLLLTDGAGLLHLAPDRLDLVTWEGEVTTDTLLTFDAGTGSPILAQTTDPDVVAVGTTNSSGTTMGYLVDVSTGDVTEIPHMLLAPFVHIAYRSNEPVGHVLAAAPTDDGGQATLQMIDVSTGEAALTSEPIDIAAEELSAQAGTLPAKGTRGFVFLPDGQTIVLDAATGEAIHNAPPETDDAMQWTLHPSPAGTYLVPSSSASGDMFVMDLTRGEWRQLPAGTNGWFLPGTGS